MRLSRALGFATALGTTFAALVVGCDSGVISLGGSADGLESGALDVNSLDDGAPDAAEFDGAIDGDLDAGCTSSGPDAWPAPAECTCDLNAMSEFAANSCQGRDWCLDLGFDGGCDLACLDSTNGTGSFPCP